jgi:excisionase family DNA binding protein
MERRFIGIKELSQYLGLTEGTLYVWVCHRKIPFYKFGKSVRFDLKKIDIWAKKKLVESLP